MNRLSCLNSLLKDNKNKKRLLFIIIFLSMVLTTILSICIYSISASYYQYLADGSGEQHVTYYDLTYQEQQMVVNNKLIKEYGTAIVVGALKHNLKWDEYDVFVGYIDKSYLNLRHMRVIDGSFPESRNEIALEKRVIDILSIKPELNQNIELTILQSDNEKIIELTKSYKLVGIIDNYFPSSYTNRFEYTRAITPSVLISKIDALAMSGSEGVSYSVAVKAKTNSLERLTKFAMENKIPKEMYNSYLYENNGFLGLWFLSRNNKSYAHYKIANRLFLFIVSLIICMIFSIIILISLDLLNKKRQISLVRAVGATQRQLSRIITKNVMPVVLKAITLVIITGTLLAKPLYGMFENFLASSYSIFHNTFEINYIIIGIVFILAITGVILTIHFSVKAVCKRSPIVALGPNYKHKSKVTISSSEASQKPFYRIARRSMKLNKTKTFLIIMSLAISISLILTISTNYRISDQESPSYDKNSLSIFNTNMNRSSADILSLQYVYDNKVSFSEQDYQRLRALPEVKAIKTTNYLGSYGYGIAMKESLLDEYLKKITPHQSHYYFNDIEENYKILKALGLSADSTIMSGNRFFNLRPEAHGSYVFNSLSNSLSKGKVDLDALKSGSEVILCLPALRERPFKVNDKPQYSVIKSYRGKPNEYHNTSLKVGDTISLVKLKAIDISKQVLKGDISNIELEEKKVKIGGIIEQGGYIRQSDGNYFFINSPKLLIHNTAVNNWLDIENYDRFKLILYDEVDNEFLAKMISNNILTNDSTRVVTLNMRIKHRNLSKVNDTLLYLALILVTGLISVLTIYYTISNDLKNKEKQFVLLWSIGATKKQLKLLLNYEIMFYAVTASLVSALYCVVYTILTVSEANHPVELLKWWQIVPWTVMVTIAVVVIALLLLINNKQINRFAENITHHVRYID